MFCACRCLADGQSAAAIIHTMDREDRDMEEDVEVDVGEEEGLKKETFAL